MLTVQQLSIGGVGVGLLRDAITLSDSIESENSIIADPHILYVVWNIL